MAPIQMKYAAAVAGALALCHPIAVASQESQEAEPESEATQEKDEPAEAEQAEPEPKTLEEGGRLDLICGGEGTANKPTVFTGTSNSTYSSAYGHASGSTNSTIYGVRQQGFGDQVALFIEEGEGRVRMPPAMLPPIRGGDDGWFKLGSIKIKENEITATIRVNFLNNPKLRLDRYTGAISISGKAGDYSGRCQHFVPEEVERQF